MRAILPMLVVVVAALTLFAVGTSLGDPPRPPLDPMPEAEVNLPVGTWSVEFSNGVIESCEIRKDGTTTVTEPQRTSAGKAVVQGNSVTLTYEDDRTEVWTAVGKKFVVEHICPGSRPQVAGRVLGIAELKK